MYKNKTKKNMRFLGGGEGVWKNLIFVLNNTIHLQYVFLKRNVASNNKNKINAFIKLYNRENSCNIFRVHVW